MKWIKAGDKSQTNVDSGGWTQTGSGDYAGAANGGTVTGVTNITKSTDWSYGTTTMQAWDAGAASAAGAWATVSKTSENSYSALDATSSSGSGNYSWIHSPSGSVTQNASSVLAQSYTDGSTMNSAGSYGYHGSGLASNTTTSELTYGGDHTYTDPGTFDSHRPTYSSYTKHYHESGGKSNGSTVSTDWTMDSSGTWQAAKTTQHHEGDTSGTYAADYAEHWFWNVVLSPFTFGQSSATYQDWTQSSAEQFNYSYAGDTTVAGGTTSGTASGGGSASGNNYCDWLRTNGGGSTADYNYSGGWSGTGASQTTSGGNTGTWALLNAAGNTTNTSAFSQSTPGFPTSYYYGGSPAGFRDSTVNDYRYGASSTPCFAAGTQVLVGYDASGNPVTRNIEDLQVGDTVLTRNQDDPDAPLEEHAVTAISVSPVDHLRLLEVQESDGTTETLRTTDEHPFWVKGLGWVKAADLVAG